MTPSPIPKNPPRLSLQPIGFDEAAAFVRLHHRHHCPSRGWKFGIAVNDGEKVVGVVIVGRPVSRNLDDGFTAEVNRCCVAPIPDHPKGPEGSGHANACSMLYAAAWRAARAMGYRRLITYTLPEEGGASLRAAGWKIVGQTKAEGWGREARPRVDKHPTQSKLIWEPVTAGGGN